MGLRALWNAAWRYRVAGLAAAVLAVLAIAFGPRLLHGPEVDAVAVVQRDFVQTVVASGHVEAPHRVSIGTQITGTVKRVPVAEGQLVDAGQVLIGLEDAEWRAATLQADVAVQQAEARLRQLREVQAPVAEQTLRQAEITLDNARAQARRVADLFQRNFVGQAALDDANKAAALAEAQLRAVQKQLETTRPGGSDHAMALSALAQARASADVARSRLRYATIVAPAAGTLIARNVEPGDVVQPGKALMLLSPSGETELVVQIDERNLHLLAIGQRAQASADAYPDSRFAAELVYINPGVDAQRGSVEVKLAVANPPAYLRQDMTVSVDIQVASRPRAILVPTAAIHDADGVEPWVLKVGSGHARRQRVRLGLRGGGLSEALDGLGAGDVVVASANADVADGARLRPVVAAARRAGPLP
jgi:HlyD family secretion protein